MSGGGMESIDLSQLRVRRHGRREEASGKAGVGESVEVEVSLSAVGGQSRRCWYSGYCCS